MISSATHFDSGLLLLDAGGWPNAPERLGSKNVGLQNVGYRMAIDWNGVFVPSLGLAEVVLRGTVMYIGLFLIMRFMGRRQAGQFGPADLLVIVMIADAAQNGLGKDYQSVTEGLLLVTTIVAWEYAIDWLHFRYPVLRPLLRPPSLTLVKDGKLDDVAMRKEMLTAEELGSQLRQQQVSDIADVVLAKLEGDGRLSVLKRMQRDR
jgi:uncharacterized membrane protein YcaP (DUF421 family)